MKFSIGIPAYKISFLNECIESILNQTYVDFELIIVNDASPDNIDSVVYKYIDPRIKYFKNEINIGALNVVDNWNKCLSFATGDFFILMGDDDKMEPDYLEEFVNLIKKYPNLNVYHCRSFTIDEYSNKTGLTPSWPEFENVYDNIWHRLNSLRQQFISDFVYSTFYLKNQGGFYKLPLAWASDDITSYIASDGKGIAHTNKPVFCYRNNNQTISNTGNVKYKLNALDCEISWILSFLSRSTDSSQNEIIKKNILKILPNYKKKKRIYTLLQFYKGGFISALLNVMFFKNITFKEKVLSIIYYIKQTK